MQNFLVYLFKKTFHPFVKEYSDLIISFHAFFKNSFSFLSIKSFIINSPFPQVFLFLFYRWWIGIFPMNSSRSIFFLTSFSFHNNEFMFPERGRFVLIFYDQHGNSDVNTQQLHDFSLHDLFTTSTCWIFKTYIFGVCNSWQQPRKQ